MSSIQFLFTLLLQLTTSNLIIFDHDGGVDDVHALLQLIQHHNNGLHTLIGITTVRGNMDIDTVFNTTKSMIQLFSKQIYPPIPIFKGSNYSLIDTPAPEELALHGPTGVGNFTFPKFNFDIMNSNSNDKHASIAIIDLIKKYKELDVNNLIDIIAVGPLTNIALSIKLYPHIFKLINSLWVMGGALYGKGNFYWLSEFNFANDPESAKIVLNHSHLFKIYIVPFDSIPWVKYLTFKQILNEMITNADKNNIYNPFMSNMIIKLNEYFIQILESDMPFPGWLTPDFYTTTAYLYHKQTDYNFMNMIYVSADIEISGIHSRGALAINWIEHMLMTINGAAEFEAAESDKIAIVESMDVNFILDKFKELAKYKFDECF